MRTAFGVLFLAVFSICPAQACWTPNQAAVAAEVAKSKDVQRHFRRFPRLAANVAYQTCFQKTLLGSLQETDYASMLDVEADGIPIDILESAHQHRMPALVLYAAVNAILNKQPVPLPRSRPYSLHSG